jgi:putative transposase
MITAACYRHQNIMGLTARRLTEFMQAWVQEIEGMASVRGWCFLPNHYHALVETSNILGLLQRIGQLHGRTSFAWNGEEGCRGRKAFHRAAETRIKNGRHYFAALNYIHHNPVRHGYVERWTDWPWSSAMDYLQKLGREALTRMWQDFDISTFGYGWDEPGL